MLVKIYKQLLQRYGEQNWWPTKTKSRFEICIGAILTQNTSWKNVEKAIENLIEADVIDPKKIASMPIRRLERLIRPSGFFKQKAKRLNVFSRFLLSYGSVDDFAKNVSREELLEVNGIGKETADSILLYACNRPCFVVDAYTRRLFSDLGIIKGKEKYDEIKEMCENKLPNDVNLYKEFHALIVEHMKRMKKKMI